MVRNFSFFTLLVFFFLTIETHAEQIWLEDFSLPNKGFWGDADRKTVHSDMQGISQWTLDCSACQLTAESDYVKTTSTSGGRLEAMDCDGEAIWKSTQISLAGFRNITVKINLSETGSGSNAASKYIRVYYRIDDAPEVLFAENGEMSGDFGSALAQQTGLSGEQIQIIIRMNSSYSSDKLIIDTILVEGEKPIVSNASQILFSQYPIRAIAGEKFTIEARACDSDGKTDIHYDQPLTLSEANNLLASQTVIPEKGIFRWNNLLPETEEMLQLQLSNQQLSSKRLEIPVYKAKPHVFFADFENGLPIQSISDGDWLVSSISPLSQKNSLQHNSQAKNACSAIFFPINQSLQSDHFYWSFKLKTGNWEPSSSNRFLFYLCADQTIPASINGWAVGTNSQTGSNALELWRIRESKPDSLIIQSPVIWKANDSHQIEVFRNNRGQWQMLVRNTDGSLGFPQRGNDPEEFDFKFFGLQFTHTSTRKGLLWADDISLTAYPAPPSIEEILVSDETHLQFRVSKVIEPASVKPENITIQTQSGKTISVLHAAVHPLDGTVILLTTSPQQQINCRISVSGIADSDGRVMQPETHNFLWAKNCQPHDLVINEIFADPLPSQGLPEYEFVELYNRISIPVKLNGLSLCIDGKTIQLPDTLIAAGKFLVFCSNEGSTYFPSSVGLTGFPALKNSEGEIIVKSGNTMIDQIHYSDRWYGSETFREGGWSLERIDPDRFCNPSENWTGSMSAIGGTPGKVNAAKRLNTDQLPPKIVYAEALCENQLNLQFSEAIPDEYLISPNNFSIRESGQKPDSIQQKGEQEIVLFFSQPFPAKTQQTIELEKLIDLCGNNAREKFISFTFYQPEEHSLIISEIFADPYPVAGLPESEYIEIFNRTAYPIRLQNIRLQIENKTYPLDTSLVDSGRYLVLCSAEGAKSFVGSRTVKSFPALRNGAGIIALTDQNGMIIDRIEYADSWYNDPQKKEGGWSLERIDNNRFCGQASNWTASVSPTGGTPGLPNSVIRVNTDNTIPFISEIECIDSTQIRIIFSESMNTETILQAENYSVLPGNIHPAKVEMNQPLSILLQFPDRFAPNVSYSLQTSNLLDECGNSLKKEDISFARQKLRPGDLLVSEVLFNPYPGGADFIEIFNPLSSEINLKNVALACRNKDGKLDQISTIATGNYWLPPNAYIACTKDTAEVLVFYQTPCPECLQQTNSFPTFADDQGTVVLLDENQQVIDEFQYSEKMHHPMIDDKEGVSLERISFKSPTQDAANWHSAASTVGFATPGYANSQQRETVSSKESIVVSPEIFSPNGDGYNDRLFIQYQFDKPGFQANVKLYDSLGRLVNHLAKNEILAQEGSWYWDGDRSDQSRAALGIYFILVELFDQQGNVRKFRKTCTLTDRL